MAAKLELGKSRANHPGVGQHVPWTEAQGLGDVRFGFFGAADENLTKSNGGMSVGEISIQRQRVFAFGDALARRAWSRS